MRYFTGDEVGIVKGVTFKKPAPKDEAEERPRKRARSDKGDDAKDAKAKEAAGPQAQIQAFGAVDREAEIQLLAWAGSGEAKQIVVARKGGWVQYLDAEDGTIVRAEQCFVPQLEDNGKPKVNKNLKPEHFVGLHDANGTLITCTDTGIVRYINPQSATEKTLPDLHATLSQDLLYAMKVHPTKPHIFATGGEERDLCVWDVTNCKESEKEGELRKVDCIWKAKNVKNDFLDLRVPVWITHLEWLKGGNDAARILVGTGHHQIRIYDTTPKTARRPIFNVDMGEYPVRALAVTPDMSQAIFSDTKGAMTAIDLKTGTLAGAFKSIAGAVTDIKVCEKQKHVVTVGMDRFLRIFELAGSRKVLKKVYLKQRMTSLLLDEDYVDEEAVNGDGEKGGEDDDLWEQIPAVDDGKQSKTDGSGKKKKVKRKAPVDDA
ncbi:WD repeat-containing protein 74 [Rhizophlyctis rosea]|uniref:WD repeat-containing protein 74 n=1 Tax=Rhizophlyctis rosea TaxID=64517 RepID=A0AAD5SCG4_9FUNG|nr:WD repeat-containing protein 74 [Rhizophlyctis rosea]